MRSLIKILLASTILVVFLAPATALATVTGNNDTLFNNVCSGSGANSVVCQDGGVSGSNASSNPLLGPDGLLLKISGVIAVIAGVAAVIVVIVSGMRYITSGGDPAQAKGARSQLTNALIGIVIIILSESIIAFLLSRL
jgi:hypothetical protein